MLARPDPAATRRSAMEGWYWRAADERTGRVLVALCGVCRPRGGAPWAVVALAAHPGGAVRWGVVDGASGAPRGFGASAGPLLQGTDRELHAQVGDMRVDLRLRERVLVAAPSIGPAHAVPGLPQYWHAHVLDARAEGEAVVGGERWQLDGARGYAEKNWGPAFAGDWWWGQAFLDADVGVAFAGGRVRLPGGLTVPPTAAVVRTGARVDRVFPPLAAVTVSTAPGAWRLRARRGTLRVELEGDAAGLPPHALPVPEVESRRCELRSEQQLAGRLRLEVRDGRRLRFRGETSLAGLERGLPPGAPPS